jgi:hypothetical protein
MYGKHNFRAHLFYRTNSENNFMVAICQRNTPLRNFNFNDGAGLRNFAAVLILRAQIQKYFLFLDLLLQVRFLSEN